MIKDKHHLTSIAVSGILTIVLALLFTQTQVHAASDKIVIPKGVSRSFLTKYENGHASKKDIKRLKRWSKTGIAKNKDANFKNSEIDKNRQIDTKHLTKAQAKELTNYTLTVINSARSQLHATKWKATPAAQKFAQRVAYTYTRDGHSNAEHKHYIAGINEVASASGLATNYGQPYEDMGALWTWSNHPGSKRNMNELKLEIWSCIKSMIFGNFAQDDSEYANLNNYIEWNHCYDLIGDNTPREYGFSFSFVKNKPDYVSLHFLSVPQDLIVNSKKYRK